MSTKIPIRPKAKTKAWDAIFERFYRLQRDSLLRRNKSRARSIRGLEQEIGRLEALLTNHGRRETIAYLTKKRSPG